MTTEQANVGLCCFLRCIRQPPSIEQKLIGDYAALLVHAFGCFHSPPNSDMDYRIFNVRTWSQFLHTGSSIYSLIRRTFIRVCTEFDSGEMSGREQSLAHNGHPSIWWPRFIVLNSGFRERVLLLCATDSLWSGGSSDFVYQDVWTRLWTKCY